jgi:hypothetical protein
MFLPQEQADGSFLWANPASKFPIEVQYLDRC